MACEALEVVGRAVRLHDAGSELTETSVNATEPLLFIGDDGKQYRTTAPDLVRANESLRIEYVGGTIEELPNLDKDGKPLGKAKIVVDATKAGTGLGYTSLGVIGGSDVNEYIQ